MVHWQASSKPQSRLLGQCLKNKVMHQVQNIIMFGRITMEQLTQQRATSHNFDVACLREKQAFPSHFGGVIPKATHQGSTYHGQTTAAQQDYAPPSAPQWVFTGELNKPDNITSTNLPVGYFGDWLINPVPQWIVALTETWWIETTDATRVEMGPGVLSYGQDQQSTLQSNGKIGHQSGVVGNELVTLMVIRCEENISYE
eukprot:TRINITY_DN4553_c0_g1_i4.p1 TRINITY_DN4553_c0_g1~~TRINITY_DN4553_c0_g1_i4.p1  ORF type:complete len:200 (-),score=20.06 TRINITY_DN4553_c0_g1_i4:691-1290(-)